MFSSGFVQGRKCLRQTCASSFSVFLFFFLSRGNFEHNLAFFYVTHRLTTTVCGKFVYKLTQDKALKTSVAHRGGAEAEQVQPRPCLLFIGTLCVKPFKFSDFKI